MSAEGAGSKIKDIAGDKQETIVRETFERAFLTVSRKIHIASLNGC